MYSFLSDFFAPVFVLFLWVVLIAVFLLIVLFIISLICDYCDVRTKKHLNKAIKVTIKNLANNPTNYEDKYVTVCGKLRKLIRRDTETSTSFYFTPIISRNSTIMIPNSIDSSEDREYWTFIDGKNHIIIFNNDFKIKSGEKLTLYGYWKRSKEDDEVFVLYIELVQHWIEVN